MSVNLAGFPPRLFLIGAQKAGTTSLAYLLGQHPRIVLSDPKEPGFFANDSGSNLSWYSQCFGSAYDAVLLDASTGYTMAAVHDVLDDSVPRRICKHSPDARFIYILRDPVERTVSAYQHDRRVGRLTGGLRETVQAAPFYTDVSRYYRQIQPYLAYFPADRFLFVSFRELSTDPVSVANRCIRFAGLDPDEGNLNLDEPKNAAFQFNGLGRRFFNLFPNERAASRFVGAVKRLTPHGVHRLAKAALTAAPDAIDDGDKRWLADLFAVDNEAMEAIAGFRFYRETW